MKDPDELYSRSIELAEDYADKDFAAGVLEDAISTLEGVITAELKAQGQSITIIPKLVKKDERWVEASANWREARKQTLIAKMKYDQSVKYQDNLRTIEATNRRLST